MCGRYVATATDDQLGGLYGELVPYGPPPEPSWNIAPTDHPRVVLERVEDGAVQRQLRSLAWGLVPSWSKSTKGGARMINARVETVLEKPAFRKAILKRRCVVPAAGYYEWQSTDDGKIPYFLHDQDQDVLSFAGLYELWPDPAKEHDDPTRWFWSFTIITNPATDALGHVHDRSPLILPAGLHDIWLDPGNDDPDHITQLLGRIPEPRLVPRVVSTQVNNVRHDGPQLIEPAGNQPTGADLR